MTSYSIVVPGEARGKQRPRIIVKNGRTIAYTPRETFEAEQRIKLYAIQSGVSAPLTGAVSVEITVGTAPPASWSQKRKLAALAGHEQPTVKPDVDNIAKLVCDALNGVAYADDKQIVGLTINKTYTNIAEMTVKIQSN